MYSVAFYEVYLHIFIHKTCFSGTINIHGEKKHKHAIWTRAIVSFKRCELSLFVSGILMRIDTGDDLHFRFNGLYFTVFQILYTMKIVDLKTPSSEISERRKFKQVPIIPHTFCPKDITALWATFNLLIVNSSCYASITTTPWPWTSINHWREHAGPPWSHGFNINPRWW